MALCKRGSSGGEVREIQEKLASLGFYSGPCDGVFGEGTEAAVIAFQRERGLSPDGAVGPRTSHALFSEKATSTALDGKPLDYRCLALTGSFETGSPPPGCFASISGDFDGQGMSFGALQWNFGKCTLQPLLLEMLKAHRGVMEEIFGDKLPSLESALHLDRDGAVAFARSMQDHVKNSVKEPWKGMWQALGKTAEFQEIETRSSGGFYRKALIFCHEYGLWSERAVSLMFDIAVQNGSIGPKVKARILDAFAKLPSGLKEEDSEVERLRIVANRRAEAADGRWVEDVRARKLCLANGRGTVHGISYDLEGGYGIRLERFVI